MTNTTFADIRNYLQTQLTTLLPAGTGKIQDLKRGTGFDFSGYIACRYFVQEVSEQLEDQRNQNRTVKYRIELLTPLGNDNRSTLEDMLEDATEAVMNVIDADY